MSTPQIVGPSRKSFWPFIHFVPRQTHFNFVGLAPYAAVLSVLGQTERSIEVLVIDGTSTDRTVELVQSVDDDRVRVLRNPYLSTANQVQSGCTKARCASRSALRWWEIASPRSTSSQIQMLSRNRSSSDSETE